VSDNGTQLTGDTFKFSASDQKVAGSVIKPSRKQQA